MIEYLESELKPSSHLCVAFTGILHGLGHVGFEFHKTLGRVGCAALFVRDLDCHWYQDIEPIQARIRQALRETGATRLTCLGNSMGGFGALLHGALAGADAVLAVVPQTVIGRAAVSEIGDDRYAEMQARIPLVSAPDLAEVRPARGRVTVCCSSDEPRDVRYLERLAGAWPVQKVIVEGGGHDTSLYLKERGELMPMVELALL